MPSERHWYEALPILNQSKVTHREVDHEDTTDEERDRSADGSDPYDKIDLGPNVSIFQQPFEIIITMHRSFPLQDVEVINTYWVAEGSALLSLRTSGLNMIISSMAFFFSSWSIVWTISQYIRPRILAAERP